MVKEEKEYNNKQKIALFYIVATITNILTGFITGLLSFKVISIKKMIIALTIFVMSWLIYTVATLTIFKKIQESMKD